jgi:hypothetical protein
VHYRAASEVREHAQQEIMAASKGRRARGSSFA